MKKSLDTYLGRQEIVFDVADATRVAAMAALLDHDDPPWPEGELPALGHWLCFQPHVLQSRIGRDGHPQRDGDALLPDAGLPRRMWAGSRVRFEAPISLGATITRLSTIERLSSKDGRTGPMLIVTIRHEISGEAGLAIVEEQDIVYQGGSYEPRQAPAAEPWASAVRREIVPDPVLLFRYSAVTFNGHRIHYDRDYCRDVEGYPGLVVQGPLVATLLLYMLPRQRLSGRVRAFSFRALSPLFDGERLALEMRESGDGTELRAFGPSGMIMTALAELA